MNKILLILTLFLIGINVNAQSTENVESSQTTQIYCEVTCYQYNLFKNDVNALVDFGIADKAKEANGWIYNSETDKKYSFASPMSVFAFMARRGWEYKDAIIITESIPMKNTTNVWHFILTKKVPVNFTDDDIIGDIDYRRK